MTFTRAGTRQRSIRIVRATTVRDSSGDTMGVCRVGVFYFAVTRVVRGIAGERTRSNLTGSLYEFKDT